MFLWVTNKVKFVDSAEECPSTSGVALQLCDTNTTLYFWSVETIKISLYAQAWQLPLLQAQSSVWNHLSFLNNFLMTVINTNKMRYFVQIGNEFLTARHLVFWKPYPWVKILKNVLNAQAWRICSQQYKNLIQNRWALLYKH